MKDQLIQLIQSNGIFIRHGHWKMDHHFAGASHPQVIQYVVMDGRDRFFISGDPVEDSDIDWLYQELTA